MMNDFSQAQNNSSSDDFSQAQNSNLSDDFANQVVSSMQVNPVTDTNKDQVPVFKVDLSGLKEKAVEPMIVGSSLEAGPMTINKNTENSNEIEKKVEFGNEALKSIENGREELKVEKIEGTTEGKQGDNSSSPIISKKDEAKLNKDVTKSSEVKEVKNALKFNGYPIEETLLNDVEKVKKGKGKGDPSDGLTGILLFLDRLFRIRDRESVK